MSTRLPKYRLHKGSGQALVQIEGQRIYLGVHGTKESKEKYRRQVAEWLATQGPSSRAALNSHASGGITLNELILSYWKYAGKYYVKHGRPTDEQAGIRAALRFLRRLYGFTPARYFGPLGLKAVRETMIEAGLSRRVVNKYVQRIRRMFRWGVENELVTVEVYQALMTVGWLRKGRCKARELPPVRPVPDVHVDTTLPHLPKIVQAMVRFQRVSGCRPEDVCNLRPRHVDTTGEVWCCQPDNHKMEHTGRPRRFFIGPKAQEVLRPFLDRAPEAYCFSPKESAETQLAKRRRQRKTPVSNGKGKIRPKRAPGDHYTRHSYNQAIERACNRAGVPKWSPNQLRHSRGTEVREQHGLEASQTVLGHARADVTQLYAARNEELARKIVLKSG